MKVKESLANSAAVTWGDLCVAVVQRSMIVLTFGFQVWGPGSGFLKPATFPFHTDRAGRVDGDEATTNPHGRVGASANARCNQTSGRGTTDNSASNHNGHSYAAGST